MKRFSRRLAVAALVTLPLLAVPAVSQAGVIPWAFDVLFGPVGYPGYGYSGYGYYGPYNPGYYGSAGCGPCVSACSPCSAPVGSACSSGACSSTTAYYVSSTPCNAKTSWKSDAPKAAAAAVPKKAAPAASETTFDEGALNGELKKTPFPPTPVNPTNAASPAATGAGANTTEAPAAAVTTGSQTDTAVGVGADTSGFPAGDDGEFSTPKAGKPAEAAPATGAKAPALDAVDKALGLDGKSSWIVTPTHRRLAQRATFRDAQVARRSVPVKTDAGLPAQSGARIAAR